ncbi:MAG: hypothetical protein HYV07_02110 [Deltaproteobacteria bacterium]|nr:hypothetical protein [Deltaproteobacteria bacterium]
MREMQRLGAVFLGCLAGCSPLTIPEPPGLFDAGSVVYLGQHHEEWEAFAQGAAPGRARLVLEGSTNVFAGIYPVSLSLLDLPEGVMANQRTGRPLPGAASILVYDEGSSDWRPLEAWPDVIQELRFEGRPRDRSNSVVAVDVGKEFSCALRGDGRVSCWGHGPNGELGVRGVQLAEGPMEALARGLDDVVAGASFVCGTNHDRNVLCWGDGSSGQLGRAEGPDPPAPGRVEGISDTVLLRVGSGHACALSAAGRVHCWGANNSGQVEDSEVNDVTSPTVVELPPVVGLALGFRHTCALLAKGEAWCWGSNARLELGALDVERGPARVDGIEGAVTIAGGMEHTCARLQSASAPDRRAGGWSSADGLVRCWGANLVGELGVETVGSESVPVESKLSAFAGELVLGARVSCVLDSGEELHCAGRSVGPELGTDALEGIGPVRSVGLFDSLHACAVTAEGVVECWGRGGVGQLGSLKDLVRSKPTPLPGVEGVSNLWADESLVCVRIADGSVECAGQAIEALSPLEVWLGSSPARVQPFEELSVSESHACLVTLEAKVACAGRNQAQQLGVPEPDASPDLVTVPGIEGAATVVASVNSTYALLRSGALFGWGANERGQLGIGRLSTSEAPIKILEGASQVASEGSSACAIVGDDRSVSCWGANTRGELGAGRLGDSSTPLRVPLFAPARSLGAGVSHTCAVLDDGSLWCWGTNQSGQLGDGSTDDSPVPRRVPGISDAKELAASVENTCVLHQTGRVSCAGANSLGQLGAGQVGAMSSAFVEVAGVTDAIAVRTGDRHACVLHEGGRVSCWGSDDRGQLGLGAQVERAEPTRVPGLP